MRRILWLVALSSLALSGPMVAGAAPPESAYHLVLPRRALGPGEKVQLQLSPPAPAGVRVLYGVGGRGLPYAIYCAPYVIPPGAPPARVVAGFSHAGLRVSAIAEIELLPGTAPGAEDCLGPGQSYSTVTGGIVPDYQYVDELPELISRVEPEYPRSAWVRGIEDQIPVQALVCRSGRVLDARALESYRDIGGEPVEHDPRFIEAALAAVRQFVFKPGLVGGQPVALWVGVPVRFRR
jgi:periplasmic protein TonB